MQKIDTSSITNRDVLDFLKRVESYVVELDNALPSGYCHLDYDAGNVLSDDLGNITAVLDFDDLTIAPYIVCLGYTLWDIAMQEDELLIDRYLETYSDIRPLNELERVYLPRAMLFRHYVIGALQTFDGDMDDNEINKYLRVEQRLLSQTH